MHKESNDSSAGIGHIEDDFLCGLRIKSLSITHSNIVSFGPKAFRGITDNLDLSHNKISSLPAQLNLLIRKVNLSHNELNEISSNSFASQTIDLSHNQLSLLRENAFKVESALNLNLASNHLTSYSFQAGFIKSFQNKLISREPSFNYPNTEPLSLSLFLNDNNITHLDHDVFHSLLEQSSPSSSISLQNNPLKCDCRIKWILDAKRYDKSWSTLYPRLEHAVCSLDGDSGNGEDLLKDYYNPELSNCADDILREDVDIMTPCKLSYGKNLRCYRSSYESLRESLIPLNSLFTRPIHLDQVILDRVMFYSPAATLDPYLFDAFKVKYVHVINTNVKVIDPASFESSTFTTSLLDLKNNRLHDDSNVFSFVSKFINLEKLDVSGNQLTTVPGNTFIRMSRLQSISLQNNGIKSISTDAFHVPLGSPLYRSLSIELQSNDLTEKSFEPHFVSVLDSIKVVLNLERNKITQLNDNYSNFIVELLGRENKNARKHSIVLNENPLQCTNLIREIMRKYLVTFDDCDDYKKVL
jgi:Leucine-rich repeat (LRR) protein